MNDDDAPNPAMVRQIYDALAHMTAAEREQKLARVTPRIRVGVMALWAEENGGQNADTVSGEH